MVGVGIPDCLHVYQGISGLIELKVAVGNFTYFKSSQLAWHHEYVQQGKEAVILIRNDKEIVLVRSSQFLTAPRIHTRDKEFKIKNEDLEALSDYTCWMPFNWQAIQLAMRSIHSVSFGKNS